MPISKEELRRLLTVCNIPRQFWNCRLPDCGPTGVQLREYLQSQDRIEDIRNGKAIWLYSPFSSVTSQYRSTTQTFITLAREMVLLGDGVYYITRHSLQAALNEGDADYYRKLRRCQALFISQFLEESDPFPYSETTRFDIEDFLYERMDEQLRTYYEADAPMEYKPGSIGNRWSRKFYDRLKLTTSAVEVS